MGSGHGLFGASRGPRPSVDGPEQVTLLLQGSQKPREFAWVMRLSLLGFLHDQFLFREKGGSAGNETAIRNYHSNYLFCTNSVTKDHLYSPFGDD